MTEKRKVSNFNFEEIFGKTMEEVDAIISEKGKHLSVFEVPKRSYKLKSIIEDNIRAKGKDPEPIVSKMEVVEVEVDGEIEERVYNKRTITAPSQELKYLQNAILWKILKLYRESEQAHGFVHRRNITSNANPHVGAKSLGTIDVSDFFDSITKKHIMNIIFGNKNICKKCVHYERMTNGLCQPSLYEEKLNPSKMPCEEIKSLYIPSYDEKAGYESLFKRIVELCTTTKEVTAQGFPTSPKLANMVLRGFDKTMKEYCDEHNIAFTRYADDICVSSKTLDKWELFKLTRDKIIRTLWAYGFKVNNKKVIYKGEKGRMKVCGVVVNKKLSVMKRKLRLFRSKVHHATVKYPGDTTKSKIRRLKGYASYVMSIDKVQGVKYMNQLKSFEKERNRNESWGNGRRKDG
jgi:RNA-directed DNA polymerase